MSAEWALQLGMVNRAVPRVFHHLAHAHNAEVAGDSLAGQTIASMKN